MSALLPDHVVEFLRRPNPAVMAVVRDGVQPVSVATWYMLLGDSVLVNMFEARRRLRHLRVAPHVSLTVLGADDWYRHVSLQGRVGRIVDDEDYADADLLSRHYIGAPHLPRAGRRVSVWIDVKTWHEWRIRPE